MTVSHDDEELLTRLREATGHGETESVRQQLQHCVAGQYEVLEAIGQGAFGAVFKARDVRLNRFAAIKASVHPRQRRRLAVIFSEARILARVNHPNVAAIYALSEETAPPFMVMEFVDGCRIDEAVTDQSMAQKLSAFRQVLRGVAELHRRGIVHRDLKPSNVLVDRQGTVKVLDMGIAEQLADQGVASVTSLAQGTPAYMAPEQSLGQPAQPAADVFSLGVILFEILTGQRPFAGASVEDIQRSIRQSDPPLPRALNADIPGPLQAICLAALEKEPSKRYDSARQFLLDLERFLEGEPVTANPTLLADILEHGIERHTNELSRWQKDRLISSREYDYFAEKYNRLRQREESWVLDSRRISFSQVVLHLGAWSCVVAAFLMQYFGWKHLSKVERVALPLGVFAVLIGLGLYLWRRRTKRVAVVLLLAATLTWPILMATVFVTTEWLRSVAVGETLVPTILVDLNNVQLLLTTATLAVLSLLLWRQTKTSVFSCVTVISFVALATAVFGLMGMRTLLREGHNDTVAGWYLPPGVLVFSLAMLLDLRWRAPHLAGPFYVMGVLVLLISLTVIAKFGPTTQWIGLGEMKYEIEYSFMANGVLYLLLGLLADRSVSSYWLRRTAALCFWLSPSHTLVPTLWLELDGAWAVLPGTWTLPQVLLPAEALCFLFASVPKQMKSFFFSGLFYVGVGVQRLTDRHFEDVFAWPIALAVVGILLAVAAWRWPGLFDRPSVRKARGKRRPAPSCDLPTISGPT